VRTIGNRLVSVFAVALALGVVNARAEVDIPVVGRPSPFYGAAGSDVKLTVTAAPTDVTLDDAIILTLRLQNLVNAADVQRPELADLGDAFHRDFQIDEEPATDPEPKGTRLFRYRLRPRQLTITEIPRIVFPYYDPNLPQPADRPEFPFRKARSEPIPIRVRKESPPPIPIEPLDVPAFATSLAEPKTRVPLWVSWLGALGPPIVAVGWCVAWRALNPVGDRLARRRRSRAARHALKTLRHSSDDSDAIVETVAIYLAEHFELPAIARTPVDLTRRLNETGASQYVTECVAFLHAADSARFAPSPAIHANALLEQAEFLIRRLEGER